MNHRETRSELHPLWRVSHNNWRTAEALIDGWRRIEEIDEADREFLETHPLNPNRRLPRPKQTSTHPPGLMLAQSQLLAQPQEVGVEGQGYGQGQLQHWGYFQTQTQTQWGAVPLKIALRADSRDAALAGHQTLQLLCADPQMVVCLATAQVQQVTLRQDLSQLGYCDQGQVFLKPTGSVPQMAIVLAHQVGHLVGGTSDQVANQVAEAYVQRNQPAFAAWRAQTQQASTQPLNTVAQGLAFLQRHASAQDYQAIRGYALSPNLRTADATPYDVATHLAFIRLQQRSERELRSQGIAATLPLDMPDCISRRAVDVRPPARPVGQPPLPAPVTRPPQYRIPVEPLPQASGQLPQAPPALLSRPAIQWIADPTLRQNSQEYPQEYYAAAGIPLSVLAEGGVATYQGIRVVGTRSNCEAICAALEECWADSRARQRVWGHVRLIYATRLQGVWGISAGKGEIAVNPEYPHPLSPERDAVHAGSTILHEALHEAGAGNDQHPWIRQQQNEFCERRYQAKGLRCYVLPYSAEETVAVRYERFSAE